VCGVDVLGRLSSRRVAAPKELDWLVLPDLHISGGNDLLVPLEVHCKMLQLQ